MAARWLVAGLGNPGSEYDRTRHNVGFRVADELAHRLGAKFKRSSKHSALVADTRDGEAHVLLAKPQTYMNESGRAVAGLARYHDVPIDHVVVVHDELDLPFGSVRVKLGGGTAGHNGVADVASAIGNGFARVRVGIGRPPGRKDPVAFVLEPYRKAEEAEVPAIVDRAAEAVLTVVREGVGPAQTFYNQRGE
jgi:peptidyl-tRNA hydrolase, PTH1 family